MTWPCQSISSFWIPVPRAEDFGDQRAAGNTTINSSREEYYTSRSTGLCVYFPRLRFYHLSPRTVRRKSPRVVFEFTCSFEVSHRREMNKRRNSAAKSYDGEREIFHLVCSRSFHNTLRSSICRDRNIPDENGLIPREKTADLRNAISRLINAPVIFYVARACIVICDGR